jgi:hypothetical protein
MNNNKNWKTEYWPEIIRINIESNVDKKQHSVPMVYDYRKTISAVIEKKADNQYFRLDTVEKAELVVNRWPLLSELQQNNLKRVMKYYENSFLTQAVYMKRKEEFDALVAEANS